MYDRLLRLIVRAVRLPRRVQPKGYLLFHAGLVWADKVSVNCLKSSEYITVGTYFLIRYANCTCRNEHSQEFTYTTRWDSDKIKGCQCDYPATGYDCSQQLCPPGDDPMTPGQVGNLGAA
jgi:hypothetical protein